MSRRDNHRPNYTDQGRRSRLDTVADRVARREIGGDPHHDTRRSSQSDDSDRSNRKRSRDEPPGDDKDASESNKRHQGATGQFSANSYTSHNSYSSRSLQSGRNSSNLSPVNQRSTPPGLRTDLSNAHVNGPTPTPASAPSGTPTTPNRLRRRAGVSGVRHINDDSPMQKEFRSGIIITAPHHVTALDYSRANFTADPAFVQANAAVLCSKRRMMIILWSHKASLFAIPLGPHNDNGLASIQEKTDRRNEYLCLKDWQDDDFQNQGNPDWEPIVATLESGGSDSIGKNSSVRLTDGVTVDLKEDIRIVGHIGPDDAKRLRGLWFEVSQKGIDFGEKAQEAENKRKEMERQRAIPAKGAVEAERRRKARRDSPYG